MDFHFIAIGGVGQSALAKILLQMGYSVSGSDREESKYTHLVSDLGAKVYIGHNADNIKGNPTIVISSAIKEDNPELIYARELGLKIMHRSDCLKYISEKFPCFIGLSGTHGKTTTSGLLSFVLEKLGEKPAFAIGGIIPELNINAQADKNSKYFIAELDESDGTIVKYHPDYLVINNLEADHLDHYKNGLSDILETFKEVAQNSKNIFINIDDEGVQQLRNNSVILRGLSPKNLMETHGNSMRSFAIAQDDREDTQDDKVEACNINSITYAIHSPADYQAKNIKFLELGSSFDVYKKDKYLTHIDLIIPGLHNVYNALAIVAVLDSLNLSGYEKFFSEFSGMGRRFQLVQDINDIKIIDDYAHHPKEIQSTLNAIENLNRRKVIIFQPHRYTRLKGLWDEFLESFNKIDKLFVLDTFCAGDEFDEIYNSQNFTEKISKKGVKASYIKGDMENAAKEIAPQLKSGDIVLTLGAGDITKIGHYLGGLIGDLLSK